MHSALTFGLEQVLAGVVSLEGQIFEDAYIEMVRILSKIRL